jgi:hypothetical protein
MRLAFTIAAVYAFAVGHVDDAMLWALLAIAWSLPARGWLADSWRDALRRQEQQSTLFEGSRDD